MPRKQKKHHYIYKTTNLINGKYYIGMHSTNDLNDGYIGSGKRLWYSIKKYGKENFNFEILEFLPNRKKLKKREEEIINETLLKDELCLNLCKGGEGGLKHDLNAKIWNDENFRERHRLKMKKMHEDGKFKIPDWTGKKHSELSKQKMSKSSVGMGSGEKNSQYGTCWITNGIENKKIKKNQQIPNGWRLGRIINPMCLPS